MRFQAKKNEKNRKNNNNISKEQQENAYHNRGCWQLGTKIKR